MAEEIKTLKMYDLSGRTEYRHLGDVCVSLKYEDSDSKIINIYAKFKRKEPLFLQYEKVSKSEIEDMMKTGEINLVGKYISDFELYDLDLYKTFGLCNIDASYSFWHNSANFDKIKITGKNIKFNYAIFYSHDNTDKITFEKANFKNVNISFYKTIFFNNVSFKLAKFLDCKITFRNSLFFKGALGYI